MMMMMMIRLSSGISALEINLSTIQNVTWRRDEVEGFASLTLPHVLLCCRWDIIDRLTIYHVDDLFDPTISRRSHSLFVSVEWLTANLCAKTAADNLDVTCEWLTAKKANEALNVSAHISCMNAFTNVGYLYVSLYVCMYNCICVHMHVVLTSSSFFHMVIKNHKF